MQRQILLAVAIAAVIGLIIGTVMSSRDTSACDEWQRKYRLAQQEANTGVLGSMGQGPLAEPVRELERDRPDGCAVP